MSPHALHILGPLPKKSSSDSPNKPWASRCGQREPVRLLGPSVFINLSQLLSIFWIIRMVQLDSVVQVRCLVSTTSKHLKEWAPGVATKPFTEKSVIGYQMILTSWKEICVSTDQLFTLYLYKEPSPGHTKVSQAETSRNLGSHFVVLQTGQDAEIDEKFPACGVRFQSQVCTICPIKTMKENQP